MSGMGSDVVAVLPEVLLLVGALAALVGGAYTPRERQWVLRLVAVAALLGSSAAAVVGLTSPAGLVFEGTYAVDSTTGAVRLIVAAATLLVIGLGVDELAGHRQESETYALLLLSATGAVVMAGAADLLVMVVAFLLASIPLYALVGQARTASAAEGAMKTYLMGALFGIVLLTGVVVLLGVSGGEAGYAGLAVALETAPAGAVAAGAVAVIVGLMFKAGGVPGHFWVPDAAQGAGVTAAAFLTTVPKIGAVVAIYRLVDALPVTVDAQLVVAVLAVASMTLGNLAAFAQTAPRRLLGWSTVSQVGYALLPAAVAGRTDLAEPAMVLFLAAYAVTNLAAFAVVAALPRRVSIDDYRGLARSHPLLAGALLVSLLGLLGTPPTSVFVGKLLVATAAWDGGSGWLAVVLVVNTLASLFYYLRWFAPVFRGGEVDGEYPEPRAWATRAAVVGGVASVVLGLIAGAV
ncbi:NADH-quinone oxidoreductase subunit N [uncultured Pseudokineococcus sp.]|uniref:NADH-quinone oxidoreductase subunit N n=1 Tax=uncultured Pseudokineococcus sp. TaxID=1642928 RepID=UPI0026349ADB|nr:proton-conducting transporter membrane subunit [uncultured Pseudokineococcus sp.]